MGDQKECRTAQKPGRRPEARVFGALEILERDIANLMRLTEETDEAAGIRELIAEILRGVAMVGVTESQAGNENRKLKAAPVAKRQKRNDELLKFRSRRSWRVHFRRPRSFVDTCAHCGNPLRTSNMLSSSLPGLQFRPLPASQAFGLWFAARPSKERWLVGATVRLGR